MPESGQTRKTLKSQPPGVKQRRVRGRLSAYRASLAGRPRRQIPRAAVPSFFTLMNLFSGFLALTQIYEGNFTYACWLIVLAGFFDALDGMMARLTNGQSEFGVELDSLSDVVSFGIAPSFLVFVYGLKDFGVLGLIVASLPAICGAVRLARFNVNVNFEGEKSDYFEGLPIPVQAVAIVAIILNVEAELLSRLSPDNLTVLIPVVFVLSALMVSNISFDAIPKPSPRYFKAHPWKALAFGIGMLLTIFWIPEGLFVALAAYLFWGIARAIYRAVRVVMETPLDENEEPSEESA